MTTRAETVPGRAAPPTARGARLKVWFAQQNRISLGILGVGIVALVVCIGGSLLLLVLEGVTPYTEIVETATSTRQSTLLWSGVVLGLAAAGAGFGLYKTMPTKPAREASVSGAALGVQAIIFSLAYLFVSSGVNFALFIRQNFSLDKLSGLFGDFLNGAKNTLLLALSAEGIGIAFGVVLALLVLSHRVVVRAPARAYINFFRGTPLIWQLAFLYFGVFLGARILRDVYLAGMLILGLNAAAYSAEIFRAGIQSIERGQIEAARSLGMSYLQAMRYVILPQAFRRVIPPLTNEFVILIKDTSLVFFLGVTAGQRELFAVGRDAYAETFNATPYIGTVLGYLAITLPMIRAVTWLERKLRSGLVGVGA
jgi:His/Glu/Gln/Arg/opine family amino acid ABC transporter permease subunit